MYDVLVIGAGPAGITAAIYAKRAGANVLVLHYGESNLEKARKIDNYYGFENGIDGHSLYQAGIKQAQNLEIEVKEEEVFNIKNEENIFYVETTETQYSSKTVIIATGNKKPRPNIKGITEYEGRGISYCAICDGFFYRNKNVAVIGNGKFALNEAQELKNIASTVTILTNGTNEFTISKEANMFNDSCIKFDNRKIKEIHGETKVTCVEFEDGSKIPVDGVFVAMGEAGGADFAKKIGVILNGDSIVINENMQTNIEGLFSCGNATGGLLQVCKATYEGATAGLSAVKYIKELNGGK